MAGRCERCDREGCGYLIGLARVVVKDAGLPLEGKEPVGQPEKVLFSLHVTPEGGNAYWKIQTDRRLYVTNVEGHDVIARGAKGNDKKVIVDFAPTPTFLRDGGGVLFEYVLTLDVKTLTKLDFATYSGS